MQRTHFHRSKKEKISSCCIIPCPTQNRTKLMVWACITNDGPGPLVFVNGTIDSKKYVSILEKELVPFLDEIPLSKYFKVVFQHDNAPPHISQYTKAALSRMNILTASWPPLSPDLNIIENVWALLKKAVRMHEPTSLLTLKQAIEIEWPKIATKDLCRRLFSSINRRLKRVSACKILTNMFLEIHYNYLVLEYVLCF